MFENKVCIVTGASSGLGRGVAGRLAGEGGVVILLSRDNDRGRRAAADLRRINHRVDWSPTDLSSRSSVRRFVHRVAARHDRCDLLFNCAGIQRMRRETSPDGLELMLATNYLGHFFLTNLLFDRLRAGNDPRVITVSGSSHKASVAEGRHVATIDFDDLNGERDFNFARQSKAVVLAKILFTYELARRWGPHGIAACTLSPGLVRTNLVAGLPWWVRAYMAVRCRVACAQSPDEAAAPCSRRDRVTSRTMSRRRSASGRKACGWWGSASRGEGARRSRRRRPALSGARERARFDGWAETYDGHVKGSSNFPFAGYEAVLELTVALAEVSSGMGILDLGTGTGNLAGRFAAAGCAVWAIDFSEAMLARARSKHPGVHFALGDLRDDPPGGFPPRYDRIVSAYAFHHLDLDEKVRLLSLLVRRHLNPGGRIVIADIAFETAADRAAARERLRNAWDEDEFYWAAGETRRALEAVPLRTTYEQVSSCAGVFVITPAA